MASSGFQIALPLVTYQLEAEVIHQRVKDGYVNATAMCKAGGKLFNDFSRLRTTPLFLNALQGSTGIPVDLLVVTVMGGVNEMRGTWVHPQVAIHLAQWISPEFAVKVTQWIFDWMTGKVPGGNLPYHLRRYMANMTSVPNGHFSMLNEMTIGLIAPLEHLGYVLPDRMVPDISEGRMFSKWLRDNGHDPDGMPSYQHRYEDGRVVNARAYPVKVLPDFRRHFVEVWMTTRAISYFGEKDPAALPHLEKLLALPNYSDIAGFIER
ncbi:KilA-N domain-containing protein [Sphingomonas sp. UV9]|uniref:KilA-N domain-containing protein n=1 Tax=Sphingomonas sp. UV9 TaxID=1851410 RepID=UPI000FFB62E0|nr:KilA-N domain-containing protein [Sphingomonas sp. UV9]RXD01721.1 KilA-N domain-containing protein [Sphingomonas sp. UV9]